MSPEIVILSTQIITLCVAICGLVAAVLSIVSSRRNKEAINEVHVSINSRMDELLKSEKLTSHNEGVAEGKRL